MSMHPKYLLILTALIPGAAHAQGPFVPDPPGLISFKAVNLKTATTGPDNVTTACDPAYRQTVEQGYAGVWNECVAIGKAEPSDCQRSLFDSCTKAANEMRGRQGATCSVMASAATTISGAGADPLTQNTSEAKNSTVNKDAAAAMRKVADKLDGDAQAIGAAVNSAGGQLKGALCAVNSSSAAYTQAQGKISEAFNRTQAALKSMAEAKRKQAAGYEGVSNASTTNANAMQSTNPQANTPGSTTGMPYAGLGDSGSGGGSSNLTKALPLLGAAIPAAVLTGVAVNGGSGMLGNSASSPVPGHAYIQKSGITVVGNLTDRERTMVAAALERIPECQRRKLSGVTIGGANLNPQGYGGSCIAGLWSSKGGNRSTIALDSKCGVSVGVVVHEYYHALGHVNGQALHNAYRKPYTAYANCPVSNYGATNFFEDFAEAGRLVAVPDNDRRSGTCATSKVSELGSIVKGCQ
jgi:cell division protein ZapA (FtsZ GTPase activity inhibitor)